MTAERQRSAAEREQAEREQAEREQEDRQRHGPGDPVRQGAVGRTAQRGRDRAARERRRRHPARPAARLRRTGPVEEDRVAGRRGRRDG
ncbi:hypothetical protein ACFXKH_08430 [Streptomyces caelestis]|uniref:hypothetical protein n=1 Tax=Streptomyces caelestis TaxID=36816 RepID=UPI003684A834